MLGSTIYMMLFTLPILQANPLSIHSLRSMPMTAPVSQIQWNLRGDWSQKVYPEMIPRSYHMQHVSFKNAINSHEKDASIDKKFVENSFQKDEPKYDYFDDQVMAPSHIEFMISHPETFERKPKSLQISIEPGSDDEYSKLKLTDTLLDAVQKFTTPRHKVTTVNSKRTATTKRPNLKPQPRPVKKIHKKQESNDVIIEEQEPEEVITNQPSSSTTNTPPRPMRPNNNNLAGQSQIGNRESQTVIKPTVIVNIRGTVSNTDSDISVEGRANDDELTANTTMPQTVFNINQEVKIENTYAMMGEDDTLESLRTYKKPKSNGFKINEKMKDDINVDVDVTTVKSAIKIDDFGNDGKIKIGSIGARNAKSLRIPDNLIALSVMQESNPEKSYVFKFGPLGGFISN